MMIQWKISLLKIRPLSINHPSREQKERSNAAGKSRRLAAKTNNSSRIWDRAKEYSASEHTSLERSKRWATMLQCSHLKGKLTD